MFIQMKLLIPYNGENMKHTKSFRIETLVILGALYLAQPLPFRRRSLSPWDHL